jgi:hypothetical protein
MALSAAFHGKLLVRLCCLAVLLTAVGAQAQGISVAPSRILLDGRTRSATVFLSNRGNDTETYRISLAYFQMQENGILARVDSTVAGGDFAGEVLRYSPRRVVIPPGGSQTVRLLVRRPADRQVDNSEFRAHLSVCSVPTVPRLLEMEENPPDNLGEDRFAVRPVASVETLVPIIVRFGRPQATVAITEILVTPRTRTAGPMVHFTLTRGGERSLYGNLTVTHRDVRGKETQLYFGRGIAVYTPNPCRRFAITPRESGVDLSSGRVSIEYQETADGGGELNARAEIVLPQGGYR